MTEATSADGSIPPLAALVDEQSRRDALVADPRVDGEFLRVVGADGDAAPVVLVGVVHDHPAGVHRVRAVVDAVEPAVVALELSDLAVGAFERYAADDRTPPRSGGEMSAAIQAAPDATAVGVDAPSRDFLSALVGAVRARRTRLRTLWDLAGSVAAISKYAVLCRAALLLRADAARCLGVDRSREHDCAPDDPPREQAADERSYASRAHSLLGAVERPSAARLIAAAREDGMAAGIEDARREGPVVAVVGYGHLDALAERLAPGGEDESDGPGPGTGRPIRVSAAPQRSTAGPKT